MTALWMLYAVLMAALLGVAAAAGERVLRYRGAPGRWIWLAALVASVAVPVALRWGGGPAGSVGATVRGWLGSLGGGADGGGSGGASGVAVGAPEVLVGWTHRASGGSGGLLASLDGPLLTAWLVSSLILSAVVGGSALMLRRKARRWGRVRVQGETVLVSPDMGPAVLGVWRPRVVLPSWALSLGRRSLEVILLHEREHVEGRDTWLIHAGLLGVALMPWNPAIWWQLRRLRLAMEVDCDDRVLARGVAPKQYGSVLLEVEGRLGGTALNALALGNPTTFLRRRFEMITHEDTWRRGWKAGLAGFVALAAVAVACEAPLPSGEDEPDPEAVPDAEAADRPATVEELRERAEELEAQLAEERDEEPERPVDLPPPPEDARELADEPTFTPHTVAPTVENSEEVQQALRDAYPDHLREAGIGGDVIMHFFINEEGELENFLIDQPSEHSQINEAALEVSGAFEFSPAYNRDEPVPVWVQIPIRFEPE